jgi:hypothetical protein
MQESTSSLRWRLLLVTLAVAIPAVAGGTSADADSLAFTYASCSPDGIRHTESTHVCQQGDQIRAVLRYSDAPIEYRICLRFGGGARTCEKPLQATPGTSSIAYLPTRDFAGLVTVSWWAGTRYLGGWAIRLVKDPIVPEFGVSPLIVAGTHRLFGLVARHVSPGLRIRAWRRCPTLCPLRLRLVSRHGETRRYRIAGAKRNQIFSLGEVLLVQLDAPGRRTAQSRLWGRLYRGKLVRDRRGGPKDTAIHRFGPRLCTPPGTTFRRAIDCAKVRVPAY